MRPDSTAQSLLADLSYCNLLRTFNLPDESTQQYIQRIQQKIDALPTSSKPIPPKMQASEFLTALVDLNTANPETLQDFLDATQARSSANLPEPVPIGTHDGVQYFIKSSDETVHQDPSSAAIPPAKTDNIFYGISTYEAKSVSGGQFTANSNLLAQGGNDLYGTSPYGETSALGEQSTTNYFEYGSISGSMENLYKGSSSATQASGVSSTPISPIEDPLFGISASEPRSVPISQTRNADLNYGFGLGRLHHKLSEAAHMEDSGFYVICNAVDKSIWVAFDFEPYGETGEINPVQPEHGDSYGELPLDTQKMMIGVMRLFRKEWTAKRPLSLDDGDPFRNTVDTPLACKLVAKPAFVADVLNAIKAGTAKPALSGSLRISREPEASWFPTLGLARSRSF